MKHREQGTGIQTSGQWTVNSAQSSVDVTSLVLKGHDFSRVKEETDHVTSPVLKGRDFSRAKKETDDVTSPVLKGHDFSRAEKENKTMRALAPEGPGCPIHSTSFRRMGGKALAFVSLSVILLVTGCRQDMQNQPKMVPQRGSDFFADHRGARPQVVNTVARGQLDEDSYFYTGVVQGANGYREEKNEMPFPVTMTVLQRGQERFNVYCTPCHSRVGNGLGEIVERGYKPAGNLHDQVRLAQPLSHYFFVMTHGYGAMPDYREQLTPEDRWAVAAYIRALQLSQAATAADVPSGTHVENLKDLATRQGHPEYAQPWTLPASAVQAYPPTKEGTPAMAPGNPADPLIKIPASKLPPPPAK